MKTTVIYHSADYDGIFCREIARKFLPDADLIGWDYGQPPVPFPAEGIVFILDLSPDSLGGDTYDSSRIVWIDHHKSAIDKYPATIPGYRIDGVAACRLAWQWFSFLALGLDPHRNQLDPNMPGKEQFIKRMVSEPLAVRLAGEYDVWDKRDERAELFQFGLRSRDLTSYDWMFLLTVADSFTQCEKDLGTTVWAVAELVTNGRKVQFYQRANDAKAMQNSFLIVWEGLAFLALNTSTKNSLVFSSKDVSSTCHDALLRFSFNGQIWDFSLYHAKHNTEIDLAKIAVKYGGGGHRGACGFRCHQLPWTTTKES